MKREREILLQEIRTLNEITRDIKRWYKTSNNESKKENLTL